MIKVAQYLATLSESINGLLTEATMDGRPALRHSSVHTAALFAADGQVLAGHACSAFSATGRVVNPSCPGFLHGFIEFFHRIATTASPATATCWTATIGRRCRAKEALDTASISLAAVFACMQASVGSVALAEAANSVIALV